MGGTPCIVQPEFVDVGLNRVKRPRSVLELGIQRAVEGNDGASAVVVIVLLERKARPGIVGGIPAEADRVRHRLIGGDAGVERGVGLAALGGSQGQRRLECEGVGAERLSNRSMRLREHVEQDQRLARE